MKSILRRYINNKEINIPKEDWANIKDSYSKEDIVNALASLIANEEIQMPMAKITLKEAIDAEKELARLETSVKHGTFYTRYEDADLLSQTYFDESNKYNASSNFFHQYNRFLCEHARSPSPYRVFHTEKSARSMCNALFSLKCKTVDTKTLYSCLALRKYVATQFKPSIAKAIYDYFDAENVVDLCAGWGDRLAGFYAGKTTKTYFGVDANQNLQEGYSQQIKHYSELFPDKQAQIIYGATEDENIVLPKCDFIFTSPPYFGIEKYSKDETQSYLRYRKIDEWLENFLFVLIEKSKNALTDGGHLVLNISDVYLNHQITEICHPMMDFSQKIGLHFAGIYGMRMAKRVNSQASRSGVFCEPLYVFEK